MHTLTNLHSFGDVAAEDDAVLDYFLKTEAVSKIAYNDAFLILGRKGSGKTALVRHFAESSHAGLSKALNLRGYPWKIHAQRVDRGTSEIEAYVSSWRFLLCLELASLALSKRTDSNMPQAVALRTFLKDNYGGINPTFADLLKPQKLQLSKTSLEPQVLGNKIGSISFERSSTDMSLGTELNALSDLLLQCAKILAEAEAIRSLQLHFDELDQGLSSLDSDRRLLITGLILAARDVRFACKDSPIRISPVIYLRTDLWEELKFSDKNKINETTSIRLEWTAETLLHLVNARIQTRIDKSASWETVVDQGVMRGSQPKWNHILARTFLRPRDVIKFLNASLAQAKLRQRKEAPEVLILDNKDIVAARDEYSTYLKTELDDEIGPHWPSWEEALQACSAISTVTFEKAHFVQEYDRRRSSTNPFDAEGALKTLYRFSVIGYERRSGYGGSSWAFQYTNPEAGWDAHATRFKVHLGLKEFAKLREERAGNSEEE